MSTITEHPNATLVRGGDEAFNKGDLDALSQLFSPGVTLLQPGRSTISGLYDGRDAVFGFFGEMAAQTGGTFRANLQELYANDTQVVSIHKATATRGDEALDADAALVFELSEGVAPRSPSTSAAKRSGTASGVDRRRAASATADDADVPPIGVVRSFSSADASSSSRGSVICSSAMVASLDRRQSEDASEGSSSQPGG